MFGGATPRTNRVRTAVGPTGPHRADLLRHAPSRSRSQSRNLRLGWARIFKDMYKNPSVVNPHADLRAQGTTDIILHLMASALQSEIQRLSLAINLSHVGKLWQQNRSEALKCIHNHIGHHLTNTLSGANNPIQRQYQPLANAGLGHLEA